MSTMTFNPQRVTIPVKSINPSATDITSIKAPTIDSVSMCMVYPYKVLKVLPRGY
jgi:hypothetical protein